MTGEVLPPLPPEDYAIAPFTELDDVQLQAIVARHGLALDGPIRPMPTNGVVHALWALGERWVLRVPKDDGMCLEDLATEAVAIAPARRAGVRTPDLIAHDEACDIVGVPYTIVERVQGCDLSSIDANDERLPGLYRQLGEELHRLHEAAPPPPSPLFRVHSAIDIDSAAHAAVAAGLLHADLARWLGDLVGTDAGDPLAHGVFVHGDVKPDNLMVDHSGRLVLIDWGDAGLADPAVDFESLPMRAIARALETYPIPARDPLLTRRIMRRVVGRSLTDLRRSPMRGPSWYRPIATRLADLVRFATEEPATWRSLVGN